MQGISQVEREPAGALGAGEGCPARLRGRRQRLHHRQRFWALPRRRWTRARMHSGFIGVPAAERPSIHTLLGLLCRVFLSRSFCLDLHSFVSLCYYFVLIPWHIPMTSRLGHNEDGPLIAARRGLRLRGGCPSSQKGVRMRASSETDFRLLWIHCNPSS